MAIGSFPNLPPNPVLDPSDPNYPNEANAAANQFAQLQRMVAKLNDTAVAQYRALVAGYQFSVTARRVVPFKLPDPPAKYVILGGDIVLSNEPACEVIPIVYPDPAPVPGTIDVGAQLNAGWYAAGPRDRVAAGTVITLPNGVKLSKVASPFGGWYQVVG